MKNICKICGWKYHPNGLTGRSNHLKIKHGIKPYKGAVRDYFYKETKENGK